MTKSLSYILFEVVCEGTSFLEQKPSKQKPNKGGRHDWASNLVSPSTSLDQIRKPEVAPLNDIDKEFLKNDTLKVMQSMQRQVIAKENDNKYEHLLDDSYKKRERR